MKQQANQGASGMLLGMAAGAALGAVGVMAATQNQRQQWQPKASHCHCQHPCRWLACCGTKRNGISGGASGEGDIRTQRGRNGNAASGFSGTAGRKRTSSQCGDGGLASHP